MRTDRRGFLAALLAVPVLAKILPVPPVKRLMGLYYFIRANAWGSTPGPTEADFERFLEEAMRSNVPGPRYIILDGLVRKVR